MQTLRDITPELLAAEVPFIADIRAVEQETGATIYLVGGCVRDLLLGVPLYDVDIIPFGAPYEQVARKLSRRLKCPAVPFKDNVRLMKGDTIIDVSALRGDTLKEDLQMRDFTINNLAADTAGRVTGDTADLRAGVIRHVHERTFDDDPLRVLRAYRFVARFAFAVADETRQLLREKREMFPAVAVERIGEEVRKMLLSRQLPVALPLLQEDGILPLLFADVGVDTSLMLRMWEKVQDAGLTGDDALAPVLAALFMPDSATAEAGCGCVHLPKKLTARIVRAVSAAGQLCSVNAADALRFAWRNRECLHDLILLSAPLGCEEAGEMLGSAWGVLRMDVQRIMGGGDLMKMGLKPGPLFTTILDDVHEKLATGELAGKEDSYQYIQTRYLNEGGVL